MLLIVVLMAFLGALLIAAGILGKTPAAIIQGWVK